MLYNIKNNVLYILTSLLVLSLSRFSPLCVSCNEPIVPDAGSEETVRVVALEKNFHLKCYRCEVRRHFRLLSLPICSSHKLEESCLKCSNKKCWLPFIAGLCSSPFHRGRCRWLLSIGWQNSVHEVPYPTCQAGQTLIGGTCHKPKPNLKHIIGSALKMYLPYVFVSVVLLSSVSHSHFPHVCSMTVSPFLDKALLLFLNGLIQSSVNSLPSLPWIFSDRAWCVRA